MLRSKYTFFIYFFLCFDIVYSDFCYNERFKSYRGVFPADKVKKGGKMDYFKVSSRTLAVAKEKAKSPSQWHWTMCP